MGRAFFGGGKVGMKMGGSRLPKGYTELAYIQSSGTQYINLGLVGKTGMKFVGKFMALKSSDLSNSYTFLAALGPSALRYYPLAFDSGKFGYGYRSFYTSTTTAAVNVEYEFEAEFFSGAQKLTINGSVVKSSSNTSDIATSTYNLYLFAMNNANSPYTPGSYRVYGLSIYDNGTLVRDLVPCVSDADGVGLFDLVNNQFYGNAGSGSFVGSEVAA